MGMCFGVRDALQITKEISDPTQVTVHGELVHNPNVILHNVPALHVSCADEIDPAWFGDAQTIGLTAGTSTLDDTIDEVHKRLNQIAASKTERENLCKYAGTDQASQPSR